MPPLEKAGSAKNTAKGRADSRSAGSLRLVQPQSVELEEHRLGDPRLDGRHSCGLPGGSFLLYVGSDWHRAGCTLAHGERRRLPGLSSLFVAQVLKAHPAGRVRRALLLGRVRAGVAADVVGDAPSASS